MNEFFLIQYDPIQANHIVLDTRPTLEAAETLANAKVQDSMGRRVIVAQICCVYQASKQVIIEKQTVAQIRQEKAAEIAALAEQITPEARK